MLEKDERTDQMRSDRQLGYVILVSLFMVIVGTVGYGIYINRTPEPVRIISFDMIGNLRFDDAISLKGIRIGKIVDIKWRPRNVLVFIRTHSKLTLHKGYSIDNKDVGLMGDRELCIEDGDANGPLVSQSDTLVGTFRQGVSESVGMIWKLRGVIDSFTSISLKLLQGAGGKPSFVRQINAIIAGADTSSGKLLAAVSALAGGLTHKLDSLDTLINSVALFAQSAAGQVPPIVAEAETMTLTLEKSLNRVDSLAVKAIALTRSVDTIALGDGTGNRISAFMKKIDALHEAIVRLKDRLVQLKISL